MRKGVGRRLNSWAERRSGSENLDEEGEETEVHYMPAQCPDLSKYIT